MTALNARLAQGTALWIANDATGTGKILVAEVTSISGPTMSSDLIDVTSQESSGGFREKIIGLTDPGELSFDIFFNQTVTSHGMNDGVPTTENPGLLGVFSGKLIKYFQLKLPSAMGIWQFQGVVNGFEIDASVDDALKASVTIALSGLPNFAAVTW
jgi:predicted secreted protein